MTERAQRPIMFTIEEMIAATGGRFLGSSSDAKIFCRGVSTDTRTIAADDLFVALVGERFDGHAFLAQAFSQGASIALVSREESVEDGRPAIIVADTLVALGALANAYRRKLHCCVIGVTGSVGKTSTREMIACAFSSAKRVWATRQNLNNEIGLPMTILTAPQDTEILVLEMGMRLRGEIELLTKIAEPDIAVITNIGVSHIERLGSREAIRDAKLEIVKGLTGTQALLFPGDDPYLPQYLRENRDPRIDILGMTFSAGDQDNATADRVIRLSSCKTQADSTFFIAETRENRDEAFTSIGSFVVPAVGTHHVKNALLAILSARILGVSHEDISAGIQSFAPTGSRGRILHIGTNLLIDDAYNASPESMAAAFETLRILTEGTGRRRVAAIGCVLELGDFAPELHRQIGAAAARSGVDLLLVTGEHRQEVARGAREANPDMDVRCFNTREDVTKTLIQDVRSDDAILAKGSHAFGMHVVIEELAAHIRGSEPEENR